MSIDLSQFHQVFFEESFEGLDIMESGLLDLSPGSSDLEAVNTIFRAAHSIKGGAGTFGFQMVSDFTHVVETLLDEYRSGTRTVTQEGVDLLLESVDVLRSILTNLQDGEEVDMGGAGELKLRFESFMSAAGEPAAALPEADISESQTTAQTPLTESEPSETNSGNGHWLIEFTPSTDIVQTGNEPYRLIRELCELGETQVSTLTDQLPEFSTLDCELLYLHWRVELFSNCAEEQIRDIFDWVIDDSELSVKRIEEPTADTPAQATESAPASAEEETKEASGPVAATALADVSEASEAPKKVAADNAVKPTEATAQKPAARTGAAGAEQSIRVGIDKIDSLINLVGELVITQSMLGEIGQQFSEEKLLKLQEGLISLEQNTRELQESVMRIRMVPISFTFNRFPRLVRDIAKKLGKEIKLELEGENTELDKTVMEKIGDPLVHMVRNSMDHGIESPEERERHGKPSEGTLLLKAYHQGGAIVIEITDDGKGIDPAVIRQKAIDKGVITESDVLSDQQLQELVFHPGFSTAEVVSDLSGRGVGMDVVKRNIQELKGSVELESKVGVGSTFRIRLPLTLAILDGQLVRIGSETYVLPITSIIESIQVKPSQVRQVAGEAQVIVLREEYVPVIHLYDVFNVEPSSRSIFDGLIVVVESGSDRIGLHVDDLLAQQQVVIKSLVTNYKPVDGISGATILGDGTVALILDISGLVDKVSDIALSSSSARHAS